MLGWIFQPADSHTNQAHGLAIWTLPFPLEKFNGVTGDSIFIVEGSAGSDLARESGEIGPAQLDLYCTGGQVPFAKLAGNTLGLAL